MGENPGIILIQVLSRKNGAISMCCIKGHEISLSLQWNLERLQVCSQKKCLFIRCKAQSSQVAVIQLPGSGACEVLSESFWFALSEAACGTLAHPF